MSRPEDPDSRSTARAPRRAKAQGSGARPAPKRAAKAAAPRPTQPFDSDFGVAMLVCCSDETPNES